jgi:hypothetical protein
LQSRRKAPGLRSFEQLSTIPVNCAGDAWPERALERQAQRPHAQRGAVSSPGAISRETLARARGCIPAALPPLSAAAQRGTGRGN